MFMGSVSSSAHVAGLHLHLDLAKPVPAETLEVYPTLQQSVGLPKGATVLGNRRPSPTVLGSRGNGSLGLCSTRYPFLARGSDDCIFDSRPFYGLTFKNPIYS
jgi:hypothetical protein